MTKASKQTTIDVAGKGRRSSFLTVTHSHSLTVIHSPTVTHSLTQPLSHQQRALQCFRVISLFPYRDTSPSPLDQ